MNKINQLFLITCISYFYACVSFANTINTSPDAQSDAAMRGMILHYVNEYRAKHHLEPLKLNASASREAFKHSEEMASKSVPFGHAHFNDRIHRLYKQFDNCQGGAENVAYYKWNAKRLVDAWVASPGHRRNIEGRYNVTGIGIAHGKKGWAYYTQIFVKTSDKKAYA
jgi:uncharacterized protein YkwD